MFAAIKAGEKKENAKTQAADNKIKEQPKAKEAYNRVYTCVCVCPPPKDTVMQLIMPRCQRTAPQIMHKIELSITLPTIATIISLWPQQFTKQTGEGR